ncbi:MAG: hypothetical protein GC150_08985 [Rhizobiales bacterium]|nr:hypothetical protein [Hyphomicrobiales bacterium]
MKIRAIASAVPEHRYSAEEIGEWVGEGAAFIRDKVGVAERAFLGPDETGVGLARAAVERLLAATGVGLGEVDLLVFVTQTPDHGIPQNSSLLLAALDAPKSIASFDISLGCSGYPYALVTAKGFLAAQGAERAIVVTCDPYSRIMNRTDKSTVAVFGDAATATLLDSSGTGEIGRGDFGTDGTEANNLIVRRGRGASPFASIHHPFPTLDADAAAQYYLTMNGRGVFNFVMSEVPGSLARALELSRLTMDEIDLFAIHQGSLYMLEQLARSVGIPREKLLVNLGRYGNTVSSSIPLLLEDAMAMPGGLAGKRVLISGFGVGLSWGSLVLSH